MFNTDGLAAWASAELFGINEFGGSRNEALSENTDRRRVGG